MVTDAMRFHTTLRDAETQRPASLTATHAIIGIQQTTATTVRLASGQVQLIDTYQGQDLAGDSTVPIVGACRSDVRMDSNTLRRVPDKHGNLQRNPAALNEVEGILTAAPSSSRQPNPSACAWTFQNSPSPGEDITVHVTPTDHIRQAVRVTITTETGTLAEARVLRPTGGTMTTVINTLPPAPTASTSPGPAQVHRTHPSAAPSSSGKPQIRKPTTITQTR